MLTIIEIPLFIKEFSFTAIKVAPLCFTSKKTVFISLDQSSSEESIKNSEMNVIRQYFC